ncbi:MAG: Kelch repeat-containing protein, partial [Vicinamibacterales bacterium]
GRTAIAGGMTPDGIPTDDVAVYDPAASSFTSIGHLIGPRVGHTATLLKDGRLLVAGGTMDDLLNADLELFDPSSGSSTLVALMAQPRTGHAASRLADGTVLIVGGSTAGGVVLHSAELFDPSSGSVTMLPFGLQRPRVGASATTLIDGRVLVAGGRDGAADLGSAEIYDAYSQTFTIVDTQLSVARSGHTAVLLPNNNSVLIAGGTSDGVRQPRADLFLPAEFPDPYSYGTGRFAPTGEMTAARSGAIGGPTHVEGYAFVMGGGPADAEAYRFATIKTDKDDYAPGEHAIITGSGWQPGEDVTLVFQEDPAVHDDYVLTVTADSDGNIHWDQWAPEEHDLNVRFYLMASDSKSRAQTTFTDGANSLGTISVGTQSPDPVPQGDSASYTITINRAPGGPGGVLAARLR